MLGNECSSAWVEEDFENFDVNLSSLSLEEGLSNLGIGRPAVASSRRRVLRGSHVSLLKPCAEEDLSMVTPGNWTFKGLWDDDSAWKKRDKVEESEDKINCYHDSALQGKKSWWRVCAQDKGSTANDICAPLLAPCWVPGFAPETHRPALVILLCRHWSVCKR